MRFATRRRCGRVSGNTRPRGHLRARVASLEGALSHPRQVRAKNVFDEADGDRTAKRRRKPRRRGAALVGRKVRIWWPHDRWNCGTVARSTAGSTRSRTTTGRSGTRTWRRPRAEMELVGGGDDDADAGARGQRPGRAGRLRDLPGAPRRGRAEPRGVRPPPPRRLPLRRRPAREPRLGGQRALHKKGPARRVPDVPPGFLGAPGGHRRVPCA